MNLRKFISGVSALAIAASAFAGMAVTASAEELSQIKEYTPSSIYRWTYSEYAVGGNKFAEHQCNTTASTGGEYKYSMPAVPSATIQKARIIATSLTAEEKASLSDNDATTGVAATKSKALFIPFDEDLKITEVSVTSYYDARIYQSSAAYMALVNSYDSSLVGSFDSTDGGAVITSNNWGRCNSQSIKTTDANYSWTYADELTNQTSYNNNKATISLNSSGTPQKYSGLFIDGFHGNYTITEISIKYLSEGVPAGAVAEVDGKYFTTLYEAMLTATSDSTVKLHSDVITTNRYAHKNTADTVNADKGDTSGETFGPTIRNLTIDGNGHSITTTDAKLPYLFGTNLSMTLKNITVVSNRTAIAQASNGANIVFDNVTIDGSAAAVQSSNDGADNHIPTITTTNLNFVTPSNDKTVVVPYNEKSVLGNLNIGLASNLSGYTLYYDNANNIEVLKAKADSYWTFEADSNLSYDTLKVNATINGKVKTATHTLGTAITGGTLGITITGVPYGVTINSITIE